MSRKKSLGNNLDLNENNKDSKSIESNLSFLKIFKIQKEPPELNFVDDKNDKDYEEEKKGFFKNFFYLSLKN